MKLRVGVIYGGRSGEHEVSLASAASVVANLDPEKYDVLPILIARDGRWLLPPEPPRVRSAAETIEQARRARLGGDAAPDTEVQLVTRPGAAAMLAWGVPSGTERRGSVSPRGMDLDVVFPVLHGPFGEDGTVQGLLELANLPYVGAGVAGSAVGMDKVLQKQLFIAHGLPVVDYQVVLARDLARDPAAVHRLVATTLAFPVFVKPANLGSSVGISKVHDDSGLQAALEVAASFDRKLIVERAVPSAREIECAVIGNDDPEASVAGEIVPAGEFYDYDAKYLADASTSIIPADLPAATARQVQELSLAAFRALDLAGMARVDFLLSRTTGELVINEVNTIPGFTTISMFAKLWTASGLPYPALLDRLIALALARHGEKQRLRTTAW